jgi:glyoxylase-like metal-dependent hydrolase (beta-lactamase superfamily II)/rhodanese-related sulfurtransferase
MDVETFVTLGLGDNSYLVGSGDEAVVVDPQRDAWRFTAEAERRGWRIRHVLETHVHNDYISGALEIRATTGASIVVAAGSGPYGFEHREVEPGEEIAVGDARFVIRAAPGHTFEHLAFDAWGPGRAHAPEAVFTGGSLLVGSAGRSDLLGVDQFERLARAQYRTIRDLARLPDDVAILPTHGAGSFCVANAPSAERVSTLGAERATNAAMLSTDEDEYVRTQLASLLRYPAYYPRMAGINRSGPHVAGSVPPVAALDPAAVEAAVAGGAVVVDARDRTEFAAAHLPGSLNIELNEAFGSYVGWIVPFDSPIVLVLPEPLIEPHDEEAATQLFRIGWPSLVGRLEGGVDAWASSGRQVASYPSSSMKELFERHVRDGEPTRILDVRQPAEWRDDGAIPGSLRTFVADLPSALATIPRDEELWVVCTTGHRAAIGASLLARAGVPVRLVSRGGTIGWVERFEAAASVGGG